MLQRIQTLYLFIAAAIVATLVKIPILHLKTSSSAFIVKYNGLIDFATKDYVSGNLTGLALLVLIVLLPLIAIFLYKNRKLQIKFCNYSMLLNVLFLFDMGYYSYQLQEELGAKIGFEIGVIFPVLAIVILLLAKRNIRKDEELIRSVDRIR